MAVSPPPPAKERERFLADFAVTTKEPKWNCALKSTPSFELEIELLDFPDRHHTIQHTTQRLLMIFVTEIPSRVLTPKLKATSAV
jgi:hypothetical protein